ncbi:CGGC domain-containing protein [Desulfovibrio aminophilus]|nr:CGGC domain-containing protein [Desulfovibrio aminophilus]MCM0754593.1 CGGC domain-containing protein [Desulfovibrio aminophilus]
MTKIGLIRCEKNESRCPLTGCLVSLAASANGFASVPDPELVGLFTCRCPGDNAVNAARILKSKGAEVIHWCTCAFARKADGEWLLGGGFCGDLDALMRRVAEEAGVRCVKGTAHLPKGYQPETVG